MPRVRFGCARPRRRVSGRAHEVVDRGGEPVEQPRRGLALARHERLEELPAPLRDARPLGRHALAALGR